MEKSLGSPLVGQALRTMAPAAQKHRLYVDASKHENRRAQFSKKIKLSENESEVEYRIRIGFKIIESLCRATFGADEMVGMVNRS